MQPTPSVLHQGAVATRNTAPSVLGSSESLVVLQANAKSENKAEAVNVSAAPA